MNEIIKAPENALPAPVTNAGAGTLLNVIAQAATDPGFDLDRLERLFTMQRQVLADEAKVAFEAAMAKAQAEMLPVLRRGMNTHTNSKYAKLEHIDTEIRPIYTRHGFSLTFNQGETKSGELEVICDVGHAAGHSKRYSLHGALDAAGSQGKANKTAIQAAGSTISYLRRYLTCMVFNVTLTNEDNDGNATSKAHLTRINAEQKGEILRLIKALSDAGTETATFYDFIKDQMGAEVVDDLKVSDYPRVVTALKNKLKAAGAEQ